MDKKTKFKPLADYLINREESDVTLTFTDIEKILGFDLSASERRNRQNWENNPNNAFSWGWKMAGYKSY